MGFFRFYNSLSATESEPDTPTCSGSRNGLGSAEVRWVAGGHPLAAFSKVRRRCATFVQLIQAVQTTTSLTSGW